MSKEESDFSNNEIHEPKATKPTITGIYEILEIKDTGECLYHKAFRESEVDPQLFSGILVAVKDLAREIGMLEIEDISMRSLKKEKAKLRYFFEPGPGCLTVISADRNVNKAEIREYLLKLHKIFLGKHFQRVIDNWNGNISIFEKFDIDIENILKESKIPPIPIVTLDF
ncbi:MAG: hypothetical protein ACE5R6_01455 [Candidatus Heimdallarchaeota archaeon]